MSLVWLSTHGRSSWLAALLLNAFCLVEERLDTTNKQDLSTEALKASKDEMDQVIEDMASFYKNFQQKYWTNWKNVANRKEA